MTRRTCIATVALSGTLPDKLEAAAAILNAATRRDVVTTTTAYDANRAVHIALRALGAKPCPDMSPKRVAAFLNAAQAVPS